MTATSTAPAPERTPEPRSTSGTAVVATAIIVGFIAGVFGFATGVGLGWNPLGSRPTIVEGTITAVAPDGWSMSVDLVDDAAEEGGFVVAGARWRVGAGEWVEGPAAGAPTCVTSARVGEAIRFAAVPVRPALAAEGRRVVAWVECEPSDRSG